VFEVCDYEISYWIAVSQIFLTLYGQMRKGSVSRVYPTTSQGTGTIGVEVVVDNTARDWFPGQVVTASYVMATKTGLFVPVEAVVNRGEKNPYIFRVIKGKAVKHAVNVGDLYGDKLEITSGLAAGDQVVTRGAELLFDGDRVKAVGGSEQ